MVVAERQARKKQFSHSIGFFQVRIPGENEIFDAQFVVFLDARRYCFGATHQGSPGSAADQADAGPEVRADFEILSREVGGLRSLESEHAPLAVRVLPD